MLGAPPTGRSGQTCLTTVFSARGSLRHRHERRTDGLRTLETRTRVARVQEQKEQKDERGRGTPTVATILIALVIVIAFVVARSGQESDRADTPLERGRQIYGTICIACHHPDPSKEHGTAGTNGPPIAGSSFELIKMRVLSTSYPEGYKPKRDTRLMTTFALEEDQLRALHTFLNHPKAGGPDKAGETGDENGK